MKSTGDEIKTLVALAPQAKAAGALNGIGIDVKGFKSAVFTCVRGAETGSPTAYTIAFKLQESTDNSTFSDISGVTVTMTGDISTDSDQDEIATEFELDLTDSTYRYVRVVSTPAFTGGSTPTVLVAATVSLGEATSKPTAAT